MNRTEFDIIVVGGGHAGAEAAWAAANLGATVALVTLDPSRTGVMSCNPSIGGLAKGQIVREIDALGGLMGLAADATGINFKVLNSSRGAAVRGPRCQCDKHAYAEEVQRLLASRPEITTIAGSVEEVLHHHQQVTGVVVVETDTGERVRLGARAVVLTTGTFMRALMHKGEDQTPGGRVGEGSAVGISSALKELGFELGRLKTGTPPRLLRSSIDWDDLEPQLGDHPVLPFSDLSRAQATHEAPWRPPMEQVDCRITNTTPEAHALIEANLHRAPMYNGQIECAGPRYCPSIEDKVVRFTDRTSHHVFLEPESHRDESIYANGVSTSLPEDVQIEIVRSMPGCSRAEVLQWGYAVEYDMVYAHQIDATCMTKRIEGFFLAGQINGTSGYEEAAAQGLLAGLNAVRYVRGEAPITLGRDQAYIGVMMDDLVTKTPVEPYRMFTSRAEHRLILRADNAPDRLTTLGREWGLVDDERWGVFEKRKAQLMRARDLIDSTRIQNKPLAEIVRRPDYTIDDLARDLSHAADSWMQGVLTTALADRQYEGYIRRELSEAKRQRTMEKRRIPTHVDYDTVEGLRNEARHALSKFRPSTFGQASRLEGVTPADLTILMVAAKG